MVATPTAALQRAGVCPERCSEADGLRIRAARLFSCDVNPCNIYLLFIYICNNSNVTLMYSFSLFIYVTLIPATFIYLFIRKEAEHTVRKVPPPQHFSDQQRPRSKPNTQSPLRHIQRYRRKSSTTKLYNPNLQYRLNNQHP